MAQCDCFPVRPQCARVPHHVQHWGPDGTVQVVDIGRCLGRCGSGHRCLAKTEERLVCADDDITTGVACTAATGAERCPAGHTCQDDPGDKCVPGNADGVDCPGFCVPKCDRFKVIVDCECGRS